MRRRTRRRLLSSLVVLLLLGAAGGWLGYRALQVRTDLTAARSALTGVGLDPAAPSAAADLAAAGKRTASARAASQDPLWSLVSRVPVLGDPFRLVGGVAEVADGLARSTLPDLMSAADGLATVRGASGSGVPVQVLADLQGPLVRADGELQQARFALENLPSVAWLRPVEDARSELLTDVRRLAGPVRTGSAAAQIGPAMLGAAGPRRYFVVFQNRAEVRPDGGLLGGFAEVVLDRGQLTVARFGQNSDLPPLGRVASGVRPEFLAAYGNRGAGENWVNTNISPHFPDNAQALAAMYREAAGREVDGVIALDAAALAALAALTPGDLQVPGHGPLPAADIAAFLERDQYELGLERDVRKDLVADVGQQALQRLQSTDLPVRELLTTLGRLAGQGHVKLASTRDAEQQVLLRFPVSGAAGGDSPYAGVFLSNSAGSKLDAHLSQLVRYSCAVRGQVVLTTLLRNAPPPGLPDYVTLRADNPPTPVPVGQNRMTVTVLGDPGTGLGAVTLDGEPLSGLVPSQVAGHSAWTTTIELPPGQVRALSVVLQGQSAGRPRVQVQPLVQPPRVEVDPACG